MRRHRGSGAPPGRRRGRTAARRAILGPGRTAVSPVDAEVVRRLVAESRRRQGLPERVTDPAAVARLALLLRTAPAGRGSGEHRPPAPGRRSSAGPRAS